MKDNTPSRTAQYMALFRAIETKRPLNKRLFTDSLAINFLDKGLQSLVVMAGLPGLQPVLAKIIHRQAPGALSSGIARTRYIDTLVQRTIADGSNQLIILGAGFDTRAIRLNCLQQIPVIEIDHPSTSAFKRQTLKARLKRLPPNSRYLQLDFNQQRLDSLLADQRIDSSLPTTFLWEGVTNYLTAEAIDQTFSFVQQFSTNSQLIFTYVDRQVLTNPGSFVGTERLFDNLRRNGEEWTFGFTPAELPAYLKRFNLVLEEDQGANEYRTAYMPERVGLLEGYEFYRVYLAWLTKPEPGSAPQR